MIIVGFVITYPVRSLVFRKYGTQIFYLAVLFFKASQWFPFTDGHINYYENVLYINLRPSPGLTMGRGTKVFLN